MGHKLIGYHGWADSLVVPEEAIRYFDSVLARHKNPSDVSAFYRLFMVPGMSHCSGGPGPNSFDALSAVVEWVERGVAPERIIATKYIEDNKAKGVAAQRPLCPYPAVARYVGTGSPDDAANFVCAQNPGKASNVTRMYVFGDSYSDTGAGYQDGDGPTAVAYFARRLGLKLGIPSEPEANAAASTSPSAAPGPEGRWPQDERLPPRSRDGRPGRRLRLACQPKQLTFHPEATLFFLAGGLNDGRLPSYETVANLEAHLRKLYVSVRDASGLPSFPPRSPRSAKSACASIPSSTDPCGR